MAFRQSHLLGLADLDAGEITDLLDRADTIWGEGPGPPGDRRGSAPGLSVANVFLEPSTRTRCSFEIAERNLGVGSISIGDGLSMLKGETLADTGRTLAAMGVNVFVLRHPDPDAPRRLAAVLPGANVINAGAGAGEHPTQGLLDLLTLRRRWGDLDGRRIAIVGDILHSRVAGSNYHGLRRLGAEVTLCGPAALLPAAGTFPDAVITEDLTAALAEADAVMALRIQRERFGDEEGMPDVAEYRAAYGLTAERVAGLAEDVPVLHPGPFNRDVEIDSDVVDGPRSLIRTQVSAGVAVRMAVLTAFAESRSGV